MSFRTVLATTALLAIAIAPAAAQAQGRMYKCVDASGKTFYTQTPPKECLGRTVDELDKRANVTRRNEVLTPEQQAAREAERKKKAEEDIAAKEERRKNTALLNTYSSEKDVEEARARALKAGNEAIKDTEKRIAEGEKRRAALNQEAEFYKKTAMPAKLKQDLQNNENELKNQQELLDVKKKEIGLINSKYDEDKRRFVELTRSGSGKK